MCAILQNYVNLRFEKCEYNHKLYIGRPTEVSVAKSTHSLSGAVLVNKSEYFQTSFVMSSDLVEMERFDCYVTRI